MLLCGPGARYTGIKVVFFFTKSANCLFLSDLCFSSESTKSKFVSAIMPRFHTN